MMKLRLFAGVLAFSCISAASASGAGLDCFSFSLFSRTGRRDCRNCPDDYCAKPMPILPCPQKYCGVDDYCRKPPPALPCPQRYRGPDDYCAKPCDIRLPPCDPPWYTCGGCATCASPAAAKPDSGTVSPATK